MNLSLFQITDSALPIGGYTHSWGLEAALARRIIHDAQSLEHWTRAWVTNSLAPLEGVIVANVCRLTHQQNWQAIAEANDRLNATIATPSLRKASREMGEQLLALAETWPWSSAGTRALLAACTPDNGQEGAPVWHHSSIFGVLGALAGCDAETSLAAFLLQGSLGMIGAGVRAVPVGHTHGQQILAYLHDDLQQLTDRYAAAPLETAGSSSSFYEVLCDEQQKLYTRLFRS